MNVDDNGAKDPYLKQSRSRPVQPKKINDIGSWLFIYALPNEYIVPIGVDGAKPTLGGRFFRIGRKFLKVPASVETVYFTSDNANRNYQGLKIDGYAVWRVDPERPEVAIRTLDFFDQMQPMDNTNRILQTICTEAIRHIIANITIDDALRKKNEIAEQLKSQLAHVQVSWGIVFDQVGIERITILSSEVFDDLQQKNRDELRFAAANSKMETDQLIEQKKAEYLRETEKTHTQSERESRILKSTTETEIRTIELNQQAQRELEELQFAEQKLIREKQAVKSKMKADTDENIFQAEEQHRQLNAEVATQTDAEIARAKEQLRLTIAKTETQIAELEKSQSSLLIKQQLEEQLLVDKQALKYKRLAERQQEKLKLKAEKQQSLLALLQQREKINYEMKLQTMECEKLEEELKNNVSSARIQAEFVRQLPEIAAAIKIDHYSAFDTSGSSPLTATIAQILNIFENSKVEKLFTSSEGEKTEE
jgi:hypothetical protein